MVHANTGFTKFSPPTTRVRGGRDISKRMTVGILATALCVGTFSLASAQSYYARRPHPYARDYMAQVGPVGAGGSVVGAWRYGLAAHRPNDRAYPMTEWSGPATATGGPSGGIN